MGGLFPGGNFPGGSIFSGTFFWGDFFPGGIFPGTLARLGGLARLGEMIFIPRSYRIFYLSSIKKFVTSLEKRLFDQLVFTVNSDLKPSCRTNVLILLN